MKICEIIDEYRGNKVLGYLFYYEKERAYTIKLAEGIPQEELPLFLDSFQTRGVFSIGPEWSRRWVEERIIPRDRQNLGEILVENRLKEYDDYKLLLLAEGRKLRFVNQKESLYRSGKLAPGGSGITWGEGLFLPASQLYGQGERFPIDRRELEALTNAYTVDTAEVCRELDCSRQYVSQIVRSRTLSVLKESGNTKLYARGDVERLKE